MLRERGIAREWVLQAIDGPARVDRDDDGSVHYFRPVPEYENRVLRVVVWPESRPARVVTVFFDRRQKGKL